MTAAMKIEILKRLARGRGTCSGDYRIMERETARLCPVCKARYDARKTAAAAAAGSEDGQGGGVEGNNGQQ